MAITPIEIPKLPENLTLVADIYPRGIDIADETGIVLTEEPNRLGTYSGVVTASSSGLITVKVRQGLNLIAEITAAILDETGTFILEDGDRIIQAFDTANDPELSPLLYTSKSEMSSIWGSLGVTLHADDDDDGVNDSNEEALIDDVVLDATDEANNFLLHHYTDVVLAASKWVRRRTSWIGCHLLSRRRGNGPTFTDEFDRIIDEFTASMEERLWIPRLTPRDDFSPAMSNLDIDYRYRRRKIRVIRLTSTGGTDQFQDTERFIGSTPWT